MELYELLLGLGEKDFNDMYWNEYFLICGECNDIVNREHCVGCEFYKEEKLWDMYFDILKG